MEKKCLYCGGVVRLENGKKVCVDCHREVEEPSKPRRRKSQKPKKK